MGQLRVAVPSSLLICSTSSISDSKWLAAISIFLVVFPDKSHIIKVGLVDLQQADDVEGCGGCRLMRWRKFAAPLACLAACAGILQLLLLLSSVTISVNGAIERSHRSRSKRFYSCHRSTLWTISKAARCP